MIDGGEVDANHLGVLDVRSDDAFGPRQALLSVEEVSIVGSKTFGVVLRDAGAITEDSTGLTISGAASGSVLSDVSLAGTIPAGSYTGNEQDRMVLLGDFPMREDAVLRDRGVPYQLGDDFGDGKALRVGDPTSTTLTTWTLEPGVELRVVEGGIIETTFNADAAVGAIVAVGTEAAPIVFSSAATPPLPGDWIGLVFSIVAPETLLEHVEIRYAGGPSFANSFHCDPPDGQFSESEDAALTVYAEAAPFIFSSLIADSPTDGINRAYSGTPIDLMADNTFVDVAQCKQTLPRDSEGNCPSVVACP